jgi:excisionase family DNA binding protein
MNITFNDLPKAVSEIHNKLENIEQQLLKITNQSFDEEDALLTVKEAAKLLSLSVPTIYGLVSRSQLPCLKKGKRLYFLKQELLNWIKSGRKKTVEEIQQEAENYLKKYNYGEVK